MAINHEEVGELVDRVVYINRVAKVVKGGRRFSFSALVVVGDQRGHVGVGLGKANEVPEAIRKGTEQAKKNLFKIPLIKRHHPARGARALRRRRGAAPAGRRPVPASSPAARCARSSRSAGVQDILTKCIGTSNPHNVIHATIDGAQAAAQRRATSPRLRGKRPEELARLEDHGQASSKSHPGARAAINRPEPQKRTIERSRPAPKLHRSVVLPDNLARSRHDPDGLPPGRRSEAGRVAAAASVRRARGFSHGHHAAHPEAPARRHPQPKRVGRGPGSGTGKTAGKGVKGQKARTGHHGAASASRAVRCRCSAACRSVGFKNPFRVEIFAVNVGHLEDTLRRGQHGRRLDALRHAGPGPAQGATLVKVLGDGELTQEAARSRRTAFSAAAKEKIEKAGGSVEVIEAELAGRG